MVSSFVCYEKLKLRLTLDPQFQSLYRISGRAVHESELTAHASSEHKRRLLNLSSNHKEAIAHSREHQKYAPTEIQECVNQMKKMHLYGAEYNPEILVVASPGIDASVIGSFVKFKNINKSTVDVVIDLIPAAKMPQNRYPADACITFTMYFNTFTESNDVAHDYAGCAVIPLNLKQGQKMELSIRDDSLTPSFANTPSIFMPVRSGYVKAKLAVEVLRMPYTLSENMFDSTVYPYQNVPENEQKIYSIMRNAIERGITPFFTSYEFFKPRFEGLRMIQTPVYRGYTTIMPGGVYPMRKVVMPSPKAFWENLIDVALHKFSCTALAQGTKFASRNAGVRRAFFCKVVSKQLDNSDKSRAAMNNYFPYACEVAATVIQLFAVSLFYESDFVNEDGFMQMRGGSKKFAPKIVITDKYTDTRKTMAGDCDTTTGCTGNFYRELTENQWEGESSTVTYCRKVLKHFVPFYAHPRVLTASIDEQRRMDDNPQQIKEEEIQNHMVFLLIPRKIFYDVLIESMKNSRIRNKISYAKMTTQMINQCRDGWGSSNYGRHAYEDALPLLVVESTGDTCCLPKPAHTYAANQKLSMRVAKYDMAQRELIQKLAEMNVHQGTVGPIKMGCDFPVDTHQDFMKRGLAASSFYREFVGGSTDDMVRQGVNATSFYFAREMQGAVVWGVPFVEMCYLNELSDFRIGISNVLSETELSICRGELEIIPPIPPLIFPRKSNAEIFEEVEQDFERWQRAGKYKDSPAIEDDTVTVLFSINRETWNYKAKEHLERYIMDQGAKGTYNFHPVSEHPADATRALNLIFFELHQKSDLLDA